jgi:DNA-binding HxlR family transcriptional regulator
MSIQYLQFCPIAKAAEIIGERWTILIIRELLLGSTRFNELQRGLSHISPTLLTKRLGQLVDYELVVRKKYKISGVLNTISPQPGKSSPPWFWV